MGKARDILMPSKGNEKVITLVSEHAEAKGRHAQGEGYFDPQKGVFVVSNSEGASSVLGKELGSIPRGDGTDPNSVLQIREGLMLALLAAKKESGVRSDIAISGVVLMPNESDDSYTLGVASMGESKAYVYSQKRGVTEVSAHSNNDKPGETLGVSSIIDNTNVNVVPGLKPGDMIVVHTGIVGKKYSDKDTVALAAMNGKGDVGVVADRLAEKTDVSVVVVKVPSNNNEGDDMSNEEKLSNNDEGDDMNNRENLKQNENSQESKGSLLDRLRRNKLVVGFLGGAALVATVVGGVAVSKKDNVQTIVPELVDISDRDKAGLCPADEKQADIPPAGKQGQVKVGINGEPVTVTYTEGYSGVTITGLGGAGVTKFINKNPDSSDDARVADVSSDTDTLKAYGQSWGGFAAAEQVLCVGDND